MSPRSAALVFAACALASSSACAKAQTPAPVSFDAAPFVPEGIDPKPVGLSLETAVAMALGRNAELAVSQSQRRIARFAITEARAAYDVHFAIEPSFTDGTDAAVSTLLAGPGGVATHRSEFDLASSASGQIAGGGRYRVATSAGITHDDATIDSFDPYYTTSLELSATLPLARGKRVDDARHTIEIAKSDAGLSDDALAIAASSTVASVLDAYADLVAAWRVVAVREDSLRESRLQRDATLRSIGHGHSAPVAELEAQAQIDTSGGRVAHALAHLGRAQNQLKLLLLGSPGDPIWRANLVPTTLDLDTAPEPALADLVDSALQRRPEFLQLRERTIEAGENAAFARDHTLPQIDLTIDGKLRGFAGRAITPVSDSLAGIAGAEILATDQLIAAVGALSPERAIAPLQVPVSLLRPASGNGLARAYQTMFALQYPQLRVGLSIGLPAQDPGARAAYAIAQERVTQTSIRRDELFDRVTSEARNALDGLHASKIEAASAVAAREAADRVLESEMRRYDAGASTTFLVLQRRMQLDEARQAEIEAQADAFKSSVELDRVSGAILAEHDVLDRLHVEPSAK